MKKILVVEDDKFLRSAYLAKLVRVGFEVQVAEDGEEALKILGDFEPDLILLDLIMPKKDGFQTLAEMKGNSRWKNIPVIVTTNLGQQEDIDKAVGLGAMDYVVKTAMPMDGIVEKICSVLKA
jgi:DNA-binding response OmpR family regulator